MKKAKLLILFLAICMLFSLVSCSIGQMELSHTESHSESSTQAISEGVSEENSLTDSSTEDNALYREQLVVHYFDVGQGDSIFIELPDDRCMLIDASVSQFEQVIEQNIRNLGYNKIDFVIATHPHADHIGGMTHILDTFEIGCIYMPNVAAGTKTYTDMAEKILQKDIKTIATEAGVTVIAENELKAMFLAPFAIDEDDQNKNSAVLYLSYNETSFLFMGDADTDIEKQIGKIDCDVLKVGHHGSRTASDKTFLAYATPAYAIISCGKGNSYGHPHDEAMERLTACGAEIFRTDQLGNITVISDGKNITVKTNESYPARGETKQWVLNTNSMKIHDPSCKYVRDIADKNKALSDKTIQELTEEGYTACGACKPHA